MALPILLQGENSPWPPKAFVTTATVLASVAPFWMRASEPVHTCSKALFVACVS